MYVTYTTSVGGRSRQLSQVKLGGVRSGSLSAIVRINPLVALLTAVGSGSGSTSNFHGPVGLLSPRRSSPSPASSRPHKNLSVQGHADGVPRTPLGEASRP